MFTKINFDKYFRQIRPLKGVLIFIVVMMAANWFWKIFVHDGDYDPNVTFLGLDITAPFRFEQKEIIRVVSLIFELFGIPFAINHGTAFEFVNRQSSDIAWGCTGLKQAFIFMCIMIFSCGSWRSKWWYILGGLVVVHIVNIVRISVVGIVLSHNPAAFDLVHTYFFKYIFYLIIFLMWVVWEEYFIKKELRTKKETGATDNQ
jgi:exosortase/archaeosortase family protein